MDELALLRSAVHLASSGATSDFDLNPAVALPPDRKLRPAAVLIAFQPGKGIWLSLVAGILGAVGAFGILLAFGAKGTPQVVMSIVFAGAPLINALVGSLLHPPKNGWGQVNPMFFAGILLAVSGGYLVARYNPANLAPPKKAPAPAAAATTSHKV